jgi:methionyl aminopeptidase
MAYTRVKTTTEIEAMRISGKMLATVLSVLSERIAVGMSTKDLADIAAQEVKALGGKPSFLGQYGFPDVICISVNDEVVHGIPRTTLIIDEGDLVSMDFGVTYNGMITDSATSVIVGKPKSKRHLTLLKTTDDSLHAGIAVLRNGIKVGDIGSAVERVLTSQQLGIVRDLVGHGVGHALHEEPNIPNYGKKGHGDKLSAGMTIAIEPMATLGTHKVMVDSDGWTIRTQDRSLAAHFEHTILITETGSEILTQL